MAGLFLLRATDPDATARGLRDAAAQYARHGFGAGAAIDVPGWAGMHWPAINGGPESLLIDGDDVVAVAGTLGFDGKLGRAALEGLIGAATFPNLDWSRISGHFVALVRKGGRSFVFTDYLGAFQLFHDRERRTFSTSLLAAVRSLPRVRFDAQGVYEFAFNVVPIGDDTVFEDLKLLGPRQMVELTRDGVVLHDIAKPLPDMVADMPLPERLARQRARLEAAVRGQTDWFGDAIHCPLSGGLDSRLVLAALRAQGARPHVYVYGPPDEPDVRIAKAIGAAQGFDVEWINKAAVAQITPDAFPEQVARDFQQFDALPTYGNIFDNGGNAAARDARHAGGALAVSGGCGEIYRDFFYLADRPASAASVASTFFARFAPGDATEGFDQRAFLGAVRDKLVAALDVPDARAPLSRSMIEQLYPRVRCRALFGREISLEARYGAYFMPFLEHSVVAEAMTLPMSLKQAGRFEAMLLNAIDPALARQPSAYGHHFAEPPSARHRFSEWSSRVRPAWLRGKSYAIQRRLRPMGDEHGGLLSPEYMRRVIDLEFPAMRRYFRMDRITDSGLWRRIACLEYLAGQVGSHLVD